MESIASTQCRVTGHFGPSPFTSGADVDWPGFSIPSMAQIIDAVCRRYEITRIDMISERRTKSVLVPRNVAMYLCRKLTPASFPRIGRAFGNRDHSTVMNAYERVEERIKSDAELKSIIEAIAATIGGRA